MFKQIVRSFVFIAVLLGFCVGGNVVWAKTVIKFSIGANDGPGGEINGMKAFKKYVEAKSGGEIEVRLFFNRCGWVFLQRGIEFPSRVVRRFRHLRIKFASLD